jgi:exonuclease SbcC
MTAFGPFASTVSVDLDALAASGVFLLYGQTGAGKTTLLDGLGFALFGRVPGARNAAKRLRSDHAAPGVRTEVQLEATLSGRRMRITRAPAQERAKARGTGTTLEQARVLLEEHVDGDWATMSTRVGEADLEIADLVGMSAEQFFQVVLLPQGDFAQFLRASSVDRAEVLQKLFGTERFADVEGWLGNRRRTTSEEVAVARGSLSRVVAAIAEVAQAPEPSEGAACLDAPAPPERDWAAELLSTSGDAESLAAQAVSDATVVRDVCRAAAEGAVRLAGLQSRRAAALTRRDELDASQPALVQLQAELDAAVRAESAAPVLAEVAHRRQVRDQALGAEVLARSGLAAVGLEVDGGTVELRRTASSGRERSGRLEALRAVDLARQAAVGEASLARDELTDALAASAASEIVLAGLPAKREAAAVLLTSARAAVAAAPGVTAARDRLVALRPDLVALAQVVARLGALGEEHLSARETALSLAVKANDLRAASVNSMIARLAFALEDETPCPVCGALDHPDPSLLQDEGVSSDDEERARVAAESAQAAVAEVEARLAADQATAAALRDRVGAATLASVDAQVAALDVELAVLEVEAGSSVTAEAALGRLDQERVEATSAVVAASERADAADRRAEEADRRAAAAAAQLEGELDGALDVDSAVAAALALVDAADAAVVAAEALSAAQAELDRAIGAAERSCAAAGFGSAEDALDAARDVAWRADAALRLREAADAAARVAEALADPELDVALSPEAPVTVTAEALTDADGRLGSAVGVLAECRQRRSSLERLLPTLEAELDALGPLEARAREVRSLADLCAGQGANGLKMTLTSFVLAARLEEVAEAASVRLLRMTQGRYSLVHTDGAARGGQRSGLGLLARDGWTGQDRDTSTLSGGETFLASLALALGLADVVSAEAGGSRIGALFVDEGFGTLDEDTLDDVMDVLDGLREGGRIVGLVSHVAELRQRIPAQVQVVKTRTGSDVLLHGC